jgi:hypothetical protein
MQANQTRNGEERGRDANAYQGNSNKGFTLRRTQGAWPYSRIWLRRDVRPNWVKGAEEDLVFVKECGEFPSSCTAEVCEALCESVLAVT